jgi:hypothetical protein
MLGHDVNRPLYGLAGLSVNPGRIAALALAEYLEILFQRAKIRVVIRRVVGGKNDLERFIQADRVAVERHADLCGEYIAGHQIQQQQKKKQLFYNIHSFII